MTPIKSLAMIKRSLEKVFMGKSHFMIMIHSGVSCCSHVCYGTSQPFILGLGGGLAKTEKQNHAHEKKEKKWYTRKHGKTFMQVSPISGICILKGMLERQFSYF